LRPAALRNRGGLREGPGRTRTGYEKPALPERRRAGSQLRVSGHGREDRLPPLCPEEVEQDCKAAAGDRHSWSQPASHSALPAAGGQSHAGENGGGTRLHRRSGDRLPRQCHRGGRLECAVQNGDSATPRAGAWGRNSERAGWPRRRGSPRPTAAADPTGFRAGRAGRSLRHWPRGEGIQRRPAAHLSYGQLVRWQRRLGLRRQVPATLGSHFAKRRAAPGRELPLREAQEDTGARGSRRQRHCDGVRSQQGDGRSRQGERASMQRGYP
jgi:hypothetical protein